MGGASNRATWRCVLHPMPLSRAVRVLLLSIALGTQGLAGCINRASQHAGSVVIKGSETMQPLVTQCAEAFMSTHPHADVVVQGGGSGTGIAALLQGTVDIGMASRGLSDKERDFASRNGASLQEHPIAMDGIALVVHRDNPLAQLSLEQLRKIFTGQIRTWPEVGGARGEMVVLARMTSSGTSALFRQRVLADEPYADSVQQMPTNAAIVAEVTNQPLAIGYSGLEAVHTAREQVRVVALQETPPASPVLPMLETIRSGAYPLARTLHFYTAGIPSGLTQEFIHFCRSSQGQQLVRKAGFVAFEP